MKPVLFLCIMLSVFGFAACVPVETPVPPTVAAIAQPNGGVAAIERLKTRLNGADDVARLTAIAQLESDGSEEAVGVLGDFFLLGGATGRLEAASALVRLDTESSRGYIRIAMADPALSTRRQAAMQALEVNGEASYPFLKIMLRDTDETVRLNTVRVIQFIGTTQARTLLQIALRDSSPAVQSTAAEALQALGYQPTPTPNN